MKCLACDKILSDFEATRKYQESGKFVDLCNHCFYSGVHEDISFVDRGDLEEAVDSSLEYEEVTFKV